MPEIKTRQRKNPPVMNTAQLQYSETLSGAKRNRRRTGSRSGRILPAMMRKKKYPGRQRMPFEMWGHLQGKVFGQFGNEAIHPNAGTAHRPLNPLRLRNIPGILRFAGRLWRLLIGMAKFGKPPQSRRSLKAE